ncbi:replication initiation factor domain-containing protein [Methylophilus sp. 5]|uniref:replication initiation factor domain-containing protein n=1 Tax=Methylophilus sp. 5 TaxID=1112274 RepID=UPI0004B733D8|nr:replication initiation factor domain-containing protein [Methylophilus sp. 5]
MSKNNIHSTYSVDASCTGMRKHVLHEETPGVVIPGESFNIQQSGDCSESLELAVLGKRATLIAHPIPSEFTPGYSAITDYLNCSFRLPEKFNHQRFFEIFAGVAGDRFLNVRNRGKGMNGYERSFDMGEDGAKFCYGGQRNTALIMLPGQACHTISDWDALVSFLRDSLDARITRWDGAVDDFEGMHSVDWAVEQYLLGNFTNGGNKSSCKQNGNWIDPDGSGRTFYVGKRENGKMMRVYEKGMQSGMPFHPWVRWELELHNVDRVVPWEVLLEPGQYVAGAYPNVLGWINEEMSRIRTIRTETTLTYDSLVKYASTSYGRLINTMLEVEKSPEDVINKLRIDGLPKRLGLMSLLQVKGKQ